MIFARLTERLNTKNIIIGLCLIVYLALGIKLYQSYGISWDEPNQRTIGGVTYKYLIEFLNPNISDPQVKSMPTLSNYDYRDYGTLFETPVFAIERFLNLNDSRDQFLIRHLLTFLVSTLGVIAIYLLANRRFNDWRYGLLASFFLVLSPRIFADSFYNGKDLIFMAVFAMSTNTMIHFLLKPTKKIALIHALFTGFAIDIRVLGVLIPAGTIVLSIIRGIKGEVQINRLLAPVFTYLIATIAFSILFFPYLWESPLDNFLQVFSNMAHFRWNNEVLFMGEFIRAASLPWHYVITWILITTPLFYLLLFMLGAPIIIGNALKNKFRLWRNDQEMQDLIFLALFILPILMVISLHSVLYDGWRHLYFIYPTFLLVSIRGFVFLQRILNGKVQKIALFGFTLFSLCFYAYWIRVNHPYQFTFFNHLAGNELRYRFDIDYWGVGNRRALEHLLEKDPRANIKIYCASNTMLEYSFMLLPESIRYRINLAKSINEADYIFTNYRNVHPNEARQLSASYPVFYEIKVDSEPIITIYKAK